MNFQLIIISIFIIVIAVVIAILKYIGVFEGITSNDFRQMMLFNMGTAQAEYLDSEPELVGPNYHFKIVGKNIPKIYPFERILHDNQKYPHLNSQGIRCFFYFPTWLDEDSRLKSFGFAEQQVLKALRNKNMRLQFENDRLRSKAIDIQKTEVKVLDNLKKVIEFSSRKDDKDKKGGSDIND